MKIDELLKQMKDGKVEFVGKCVDCNKDVEINAHIAGESLSIEGGAIFCPPEHWNYPERYMYKCHVCFEKDSKFYPATEVYSRCVGYMRPVNQWNDGKKAEFEQRKMYKIDNCCA